MTYGKLLDGVLIPAPAFLAENGKVFYNPQASMYKKHGWLPLVYRDMPEDEGEYTERWQEDNETIVQVWAVSEKKPNVRTLEERLTEVEELQARLINELSATMDAVDEIIMGVM